MSTSSLGSKIEILVAEKTGFCFGVRRAYDLALAATEKKGGRLFSWGPLIHNSQAVSLLEDRGLRVVRAYDQLGPGDRVVIRSHGVSPQAFQELKSRGVQIIDATCPFVKKVQQRISQLEGEGYQVLLLGDRSHAEVQALLGYANSPMVRVVSGASDLARLALKNRVGVLSQTTQRECALKELVAAVLLEVDELKVFNTICDFTTARLEAALKLAEEVDLLLVVGGQESANTRRLRDACREILPATYQIEASEEIDPDWISGKSKVGVTAGASTPEWVISGVVGRLRELGLCERPSEEPTVIPCIQKTT